MKRGLTTTYRDDDGKLSACLQSLPSAGVGRAPNELLGTFVRDNVKMGPRPGGLKYLVLKMLSVVAVVV